MATRHDALEFVTENGVPEVLRDLCATINLDLTGALGRHVDPSRVPYLREQFTRRNLVTAPDLLVSPGGRACDCGVALIEGGNLLDVIDRLRDIDPTTKRISVVREGMTSAFLALLQKLAPIRRVMICSPWINLDRKRLHDLTAGFESTRRYAGFYPEVSVVTRPLNEQPDGENNGTLCYLRRMGAVIQFHGALHSKLYVVEAATSPSQRHAFVGSENFTKVRYQEVGLRISNDNQVVDDVVRYFLSITK